MSSFHIVVGLQEIALVITVALILGLVAERLKQPSIIGYIFSGILLGPSGLGYIPDFLIVQVFADFGILMVLFVVGMSLDLHSFKRALGSSLLVAAGQIGVSLCTAFTLSYLLGWRLSFCLLVAFVLALSSTAVAVKMLEASKEEKTDAGRLTLGVLIAQDLAIVPMILILRDLHHGIEWGTLSLKIVGAVAILSAFVWFLSQPRRVPLLIRFSAKQPELPSLVSLSFCFGFATISGYLGLSVAYGAFLAGLVLGNLRERPVIQNAILPIYSVLVMSFFISVGLFINVGFIWQHLGTVLLWSLAIILYKTAMNFGLLRLFKMPWPTTFLAGVVLSQMGEFAFFLVSFCFENKMISEAERQMLLTLTAISLMISPLWLMMARRLRDYQVRSQATFQQTWDMYACLVCDWLGRFFPRKK